MNYCKLFLLLVVHHTIYTSDLTNSFQQAIQFIRDVQQSENVRVLARGSSKDIIGREGSKITLGGRTFGQDERIFISERAQPHHFLNTPINAFLACLYAELHSKQIVEIKQADHSWRFQLEPKDPHSKDMQLIGRRILLN